MSTKNYANNTTNKKFDPYDILDVPRDTETDVILKKFKKLAVKLHPDKNKDDPLATEKFQQLTKAKDILINPESRDKYDRYGITDEQDEQRMNNEMMQEMMIKQKLRDVVQISISLSDILNENGYKKKLNLQREVINSVQRKQHTEKFDITLELDSTTPINKPIIFEGKGKKYDNLTGDLVIMLNIKPDSTYKINKSNYNLVTKQKISVAQSLCGFEMCLPYSVSDSGKKNIIQIQYDKLINPNNIYIVKGKGLTICDEFDRLSRSDIEIHFDVQYNVKLTEEQLIKLKELFGYKFTKSEATPGKNIHIITEKEINLDSDNDENNENNNEIFEQIFGGGFPGMGGGFPGMSGGFPGMSGTTRVFTSGGQRMGGNQQECKMQ